MPGTSYSKKFLSTLSLRRATHCPAPPTSAPGISIHALLAESDVTGSESQKLILHFYPRSPCGERPPTHALAATPILFLSTLSLRRATGLCADHRAAIPAISIHALLAESDPYSFASFSRPSNFYPRSPCGERPSSLPACFTDPNFYPRSPCGERPKDSMISVDKIPFLSTLSLRRATCYSLRHSAQSWHFYPRSPCGERLNGVGLLSCFVNFYPRSPCGERHLATW